MLTLSQWGLRSTGYEYEPPEWSDPDPAKSMLLDGTRDPVPYTICRQKVHPLIARPLRP